MNRLTALRMKNPIQGYSWGSEDALTRLFGIKNSERKPQAELWMGAHPNGCSLVEVDGLVVRLSVSYRRTSLGHVGGAHHEQLWYLTISVQGAVC